MIAPDDRRSVTLWLGTWGECIANLDFAQARTLFVPEVVGFGTWSDFLTGIDDLETRQWRKVWPTISDFRFDLDAIWMDVSPDRRLGHAAAAWTSTAWTATDGHSPGRGAARSRCAGRAAPRPGSGPTPTSR